MASVSFKNVTWGTGDHFWKGKLSQMAQNDQWLFENTPRINYNAWGVNKTGGVRILAGIALVTKRTGRGGNVAVSFGSFFSPGCKPIITVGINNLAQLVNSNYNLMGPGSATVPDHRGFRIAAYTTDAVASRNKITHGIYFNWIAVGW